MGLQDLKDNIKDYASDLRDNMSYETKRGLVISVAAIALIAVPMGITHHYNKLSASNYRVAQTNNAESKSLLKNAAGKQKLAKEHKKNAAQTEETLQNKITDLVVAQKTLMNYKASKSSVTKDDQASALMTMKKLTGNDLNILDDPDDGLIVDSLYGYNFNLATSTTSKYSALQKNIDVVLHFNYKDPKTGKNYPVYIVQAKYDIDDEIFTKFDVYQTDYAYAYENGVKLEPEKQATKDAKKHKNKRKIQKVKKYNAKKEKAKLTKKQKANNKKHSKKHKSHKHSKGGKD